jgi:multiple sugar transport system ATP-binding protein
MAEVILRGVSKSFGAAKVIHNVDLDISDGEFVVFVGPSGCGKSTLLRLVAGLEEITAGELLIDGVVVNDRLPKERGIAMVFQSYALYPHMTAYQNMAFGLELSKFSRDEIDERVHNVASALQIEDLLARKPRDLSGGQRQRVAIGRAIVREPKIYLFDEPLSNLDAALRVQTRIEIARLHRQTGATMIYVTHDQVEAMTLAETIVVLNAGRVEQVGAPLDLYHFPANLFVARFIGSPQMNLWTSKVLDVEPGRLRCEDPAGVEMEVQGITGRPAVGDVLTLGIRPEHVKIGHGPEGQVEGRIELVELLGESHLVYVRVRDLVIAARAVGDAHYRSGDEVSLTLPPGLCHAFDETGAALKLR